MDEKYYFMNEKYLDIAAAIYMIIFLISGLLWAISYIINRNTKKKNKEISHSMYITENVSKLVTICCFILGLIINCTVNGGCSSSSNSFYSDLFR